MTLVSSGPTTASRTDVTGAVTLNGVVESVLTPGSASAKSTDDILDRSAVSGRFTGFTAIDAPGFGCTLSYMPRAAFLNLTAISAAAPAGVWPMRWAAAAAARCSSALAARAGLARRISPAHGLFPTTGSPPAARHWVISSPPALPGRVTLRGLKAATACGCHQCWG